MNQFPESHPPQPPGELDPARRIIPAPSADSPEFDALNYAQISCRSGYSSQPESLKPVAPSLAQPQAAADPYIDPAELAIDGTQKRPETGDSAAASTISTCPESSTHQQLQNEWPCQSIHDIDEIQQQIELLESGSQRSCPSPPTPKVEIIDAESETPVAQEPQPHDDLLRLDEIPVDWFATTTLSDPTEQAATPLPQQACPVTTTLSGESIYDVRDFDRCADLPIDPIPGALALDPERSERHMIDPTAAQPVEEINGLDEHENDGAQPGASSVAPIEDQLFVAGKGDVIEVNGGDGFSHIDLACFDVKWATFSEQMILIDDRQGSAFEVHYQDVAYALFADNVQVRLDTDAPSR